jgi:hypothetical protein
MPVFAQESGVDNILGGNKGSAFEFRVMSLECGIGHRAIIGPIFFGLLRDEGKKDHRESRLIARGLFVGQVVVAMGKRGDWRGFWATTTGSSSSLGTSIG